MKRFFLSAAVLLGAFVVSPGCAKVPQATKEDPICTPGDNVFCKCSDGSGNFTKGTKVCKEDGQSFEPCLARGEDACKGGEVDDPDTNKPVDGNGDVRPDDDDDDDTTINPMDVCPGKSVAVPPGQEILLEGDTSRATGDRRGKVGGACATAVDAKDFIYHLVPSGSGNLEVKVESQGALDPIVYLRSTCDDEDTQIACGPQSGTKTATTKTRVLTGKDYYLFVDGASGGSGAYKATVKLTAGTFCGDGTVDDGEACDDLNNADGDGCNKDCRGLDGDPTSAGSCPGQPVTLWKGKTVSGNGSFGPSAAKLFANSLKTPDKATCVSLPASGQNTTSDHVYKVTAKATGTINVKIAAQDGVPLSADLFLTAHQTCTATAFATACTPNNNTAMDLPVEADEVVYVAVDGATAFDQKYKITFSLK